MKRVLLSLVCAVVLAGCGGGSSVSTPSPFRGAYVGTFQAVPATGVQVGNLTVTVGTDGKLTGLVNNTTVNIASSVSGSISNTGQTSVTLTSPAETDTATGTVSLSAANHLLGSLTEFHNGATVGPLNFDMTPQ